MISYAGFSDRTLDLTSPKQDQFSVGTGSGVIFDSKGYVVTNNHVIDGADDIEVILNDNRTFKAKIIGRDPSTDLAVLKIDGENLPVLPFGNSDLIEVGDWVLAIGNPFNLTSTVTAGIISAKARNIRILKDQAAIESFLQTDAAINPGNSGGALVDLNGTLIGINTAIASPTGAYSGYGFAIPSNLVKKVVEDIIEFGSVQRGFLGVMIRNLNSEIAKDYNLKISQGVVIDSIIPGGSAENAGLKKGDVILEVDGHAVKTSPELQEAIGLHRPGEIVRLKIYRDGKEKDFEVKLLNKNGEAKLVKSDEFEIEKLLGAEFENIDKKTAQKLGIEGGVRVKKMEMGRLMKAGVKQGFIILKVNNTKIKNIEELRSALKNQKGGVLMEGIYENLIGKYYYGFGLD
ncbi:MAG: hypothetical protein KatS3mg034_0448 [Vicingaceae bacterium]|nr:MAG: hypothetical protein KatS3mg034_0448 [Vicingaceae bacterium]